MNARTARSPHPFLLMLLPLALGWSACALSDEGLGGTPGAERDLDAEPDDGGDNSEGEGEAPADEDMATGGGGAAKPGNGAGGAGGSRSPGGVGASGGGSTGSGSGPGLGGAAGSTGGPTVPGTVGAAGSTGGLPLPGTGGAAAPVDPPAGQAGMTGSAPPVSNPIIRPQQFDFEGSDQGWQDLKRNGTRLRQTNERAAKGRGSLEAMLDTRGGGSEADANARYIGLRAALVPPLQPGQTLSMQVWVPPDAQLLGFQPFVVLNDGRWAGTWIPPEQMVRGNWQRVSVQVPADFAVERLEWIGIQFATVSSGWRGAVFIDDVSVL